jgi:hypothetical protein
VNFGIPSTEVGTLGNERMRSANRCSLRVSTGLLPTFGGAVDKQQRMTEMSRGFGLSRRGLRPRIGAAGLVLGLLAGLSLMAGSAAAQTPPVVTWVQQCVATEDGTVTEGAYIAQFSAESNATVVVDGQSHEVAAGSTQLFFLDTPPADATVDGVAATLQQTYGGPCTGLPVEARRCSGEGEGIVLVRTLVANDVTVSAGSAGTFLVKASDPVASFADGFSATNPLSTDYVVAISGPAADQTLTWAGQTVPIETAYECTEFRPGTYEGGGEDQARYRFVVMAAEFTPAPSTSTTAQAPTSPPPGVPPATATVADPRFTG